MASVLQERYERLGGKLVEKFVAKYGEVNPFSGNPLKEIYEHALRMTATQGYALTEAASTSGSDVAAFTTMAFPLVTRIYPRLIAMDLVSVQPMSQPTGKIFFMNVLYGDDYSAGGITAGDRTDQVHSKDYGDSSEQGTIRTLRLNMDSTTVTAESKKLAMDWTVEFEQDLKAYHGLVAGQQAVRALSEEITREIDGEVISELLNGASAGNVNWSSTPPTGSDVVNEEAYKQRIFQAIVQADNLIYKKIYRRATAILGHPDSTFYLERLGEFKASEEAQDNELSIGRHFAGTLNGRWRVYKDPWFPATDKLLLIYKGTAWFEAAGYYAPYIPLYMTPELYRTASDLTTKVRAVMSRYAKGVLIGDALATVTIS